MGVIKRQGIKNTVSSYLGIAIGFVNLLIIQPQFLTKEELGLTRILYSFALLVATFVPLGIGNTTIRYFPEFRDPNRRHNGYFGYMLLFPLLGFIIAAAVLWVFQSAIMDRYQSESPLFNEFYSCVFPLVFVLALTQVLTTYCISNYKSTIPSYVNDIVVRVFTIALVSVYYLKWIDLDGFVYGFVGIYSVQALMLLGYIFQFDRPGIKVNWVAFPQLKVREMMRYGLLLWMAGVASIGIKYLDSIILGQYMALSYVGIYAVAAFIPTIIEAPLNAFDRIASSRIAQAWIDDDQHQIQEIYRKSSLYMFLIGGFLFLNVNANISDLLTFLPDGYQGGGEVVWILSVGALFNMATGLNAAVLFTSKRYAAGAFFLVMLSVLLVVFQFILIPRLGMSGAALGTALASFLYNLLLFWYVRKHFGLQPFGRENLWVSVWIAALWLLGYVLPASGHAILTIAYKVTVISGIYAILVYRSGFAPELNGLVGRLKGGRN
ncbi:MAG: hypothetical protein RLZZ630_1059 [Bacteroidota bacterium]|jgi:O-antigen/teichoic acid export membrane protein